MFTLSDKQRVLNTASHVRVYSSANVERTTAAAVATGDTLLIEGFGSFPIDSISDIKMRRAVPAVKESKDFTVVAPAGIAIGDAIEVRVQMTTSRYQSELAVQARLGGAHLFTFTTAPLTGTSVATIRTAIIAGLASQKALFPNGVYPFSVATGTAASDINLITVSGYESVTFDRVEIRRSNVGIGNQPFLGLALAVTNAVGSEGKHLGKFLEESVHMGTGLNNATYGVDTADTRVDIRGSYTALYFTLDTSYLEDLSIVAADNGPLPARHKFTVWLNEATCLGTDSAIHKAAAVAVVREAALASLTAVGYTAAAITRAQEESEILFIANENSVATAAAFIA